MPTLSIPPRSPSPLQNAHQQQPAQHTPPSPTAPPYSPITPTMSNSLPTPTTTTTTASTSASNPPTTTTTTNPPLKSHTQHPLAPPAPPAPQTPQQPSPSTSTSPPRPLPISLSTNPDAIALRAAMSVLQLQRQQALRDMQTLQRQKDIAVKDPVAFARDVAEGRIKAGGGRGVLGSVGDVGDVGGAVGKGDDEVRGGVGVGEDGDEDEEMDDEGRGGVEENKSIRAISANSGFDKPNPPSPFGTIPSPQNVIRMPPVNWTQYHVVGASLDKLHEEQRKRPVGGQPSRDDEERRQRAPVHVLAAPFDPWRDGVVGKGRGVGKRREREGGRERERGRTRSGRGREKEKG